MHRTHLKLETQHQHLKRYSSADPEFATVLSDMLEGASQYDRISGYFRSSVFCIAGELLSRVGTIRIVCNDDVSPLDVKIAQGCAIMDISDEDIDANLGGWSRATKRVETGLNIMERLLNEGRLVIKVLPTSNRFGFLHAKGGLIYHENSPEATLSFMTTANDSKRAWSGVSRNANYEFIWLDRSSDGIRWMHNQFNVLFNSTDNYLSDIQIDKIIKSAKREIAALTRRLHQAQQITNDTKSRKI